MASIARYYPEIGVWRFTQRDSVFVGFAVLHVAGLAVWPVAPVIALGLWWNANTIAHNFIHKPFFGRRWMNRLFALCLSLLLSFPQTLWCDRHLAHHAGVQWRLRLSRQLTLEAMLIASLWSVLILLQPRFFLVAYVPGLIAGLVLCAVQGYWGHAAGKPISHYGRLYNFLCFNDGYHAEHHAEPGRHWTELPFRVRPGTVSSLRPPLLRWLDVSHLEALERIVLRSTALQHFVLAVHRRALEKLLADLPPIRSVAIVGGGLSPRTALILRDVLPAAQITLVDLNKRNLDIARTFLGESVAYREERYVMPDVASGSNSCDLTVIPLCLVGERAAIYEHPPSSFVLVHDWLWRRRGVSAVVSIALVKRINLVRR